MLSLWQPDHNCNEYVQFKVFMNIGGSISPDIITTTMYCHYLSHKLHWLNKCIFSNFGKLRSFSKGTDSLNMWYNRQKPVTQHDVITLAAWSQLHRIHWFQVIYAFCWLSLSKLYHNDFLSHKFLSLNKWILTISDSYDHSNGVRTFWILHTTNKHL